MSSGPGRRPATSARKRRETTAAASTASRTGVLRRMGAERTRDTGPELAMRRLLHARGLRYRVDRAPLPALRRRADIMLGPTPLGHLHRRLLPARLPAHGTAPRANSEYCGSKRRRNRGRESETDRLLAEAAWTVLRSLEHEAAEQAAACVQQALRRLQEQPVQGRAA